MIERAYQLYQRLCLDHARLALALVALLLAAAAWQAPKFRLDASADSLVLEGDEDLRYYREIRERYGSQDFLIVTYRPHGELFSRAELDRLAELSRELLALEHITSVTSILNVPLIDSPRTSLGEIQRQGVRTLSDPDTDISLARREFLTSPLYRELLVNARGDTTALLMDLARDERAESLLAEREALRRKRQEGRLSETEQARLAAVTEAYAEASAALQDRTRRDIAQVRAVLDGYREHAEIFLGGVPLIASDMIDFVAQDIRVFGVGIGLFVLLLLTIAFRSPRWVVVPALICSASVLVMVGLLGLAQWPVTVVSSNFISLMLIITLSLVVHLIVRYRELLRLNPQCPQHRLLAATLRSKMAPSLFTTATTVVSFASLVVSDIRPVIDFGLMMVCGVSIAFVLCMVLFPALLAGLPPGGGVDPERDATQRVTGAIAGLIARAGTPVLLAWVAVVALAALGITRITVENRFIDYFKDDTEIRQGLVVIDKELGGTTPLEVVLDAPPDVLAEPAGDPDDPFAGLPGLAGDDPIASGMSYWWNAFALGEVRRAHDYLDALPETGKVLSLATTAELLTMLNGDEPLNSFFLNLVYQYLPPEVKQILVTPYLSPDGNQTRIALRVIDSDPNLNRDALLRKIRHDMVAELGFAPEQVHLTGALVLYNNVLQSLIGSQLSTLAVVFCAIVLMFLLLFRSLRVALIAVVPTLVAAGVILGLMGWLGIPLDIMTVTIAAITIGIGVDNAIHYTHRYLEELSGSGDATAAMRKAHGSVGRAMYYTSIIVALGFSILVLSNFMPSIYFGLFTGLAMLLALVANLSLLPLLLMRFGPRRAA